MLHDLEVSAEPPLKEPSAGFTLQILPICDAVFEDLEGEKYHAVSIRRSLTATKGLKQEF